MISRTLQKNRFARPSWTKSTSSSASSSSSNAEAAVIATDPLETSQLYRSETLWTDFDVSSASIRVAFRYVFHDAGSEVDPNNDDDGGAKSKGDSENDSEEEAIYLCWINDEGKPFKFYKLKPCHRNIPQVEDDDHIENTCPGHAFVFCKRMDENFTSSIVEIAKNDGGEEEKEVVVVNHEGLTAFLRRRSANKEEHSDSESSSGEEGCCSSDDEEGQRNQYESRHDSSDLDRADNHDGSNDDDKNDGGESFGENNFVVVSKKSSDLKGEWEAFLLVGGFRPGTRSDEEINNQKIDSAQEDNRSEADDNSKEENNDNQSSSSDDSDDDEWTMQLVTIVQEKNGNQPENEDKVTESPPSLRGSSSKENHQLHNNSRYGYLAFLDHNRFSLTAHLTKLDPTPVNTVNKHYDNLTLGGWPCRIEPSVFSSSCKLRNRIESDIRAASSHLPRHACEKLQLSTPIWINKSLSYGPKVAPIQEANMCFHPGKEWLVRNGMSPAKVGGVEMYRASSYLDDCDLWGPGGLMLHELSHAWHCLHCEEGYDNPDIENCYDQAMKEKLYDCVPYHCEGGNKEKKKAYACTNAMEYFAELSTAFLGGLDDGEFNKWFPFNRKQVREHDPRAFAMLCQMWGITEDEGNV